MKQVRGLRKVGWKGNGVSQGKGSYFTVVKIPSRLDKYIFILQGVLHGETYCNRF